MSAGDLLEAEVRRVGQARLPLTGSDPLAYLRRTLRPTRRQSTNERIAEAGGIPRGAPGSPERRRYRTYLRSLQRYQAQAPRQRRRPSAAGRMELARVANIVRRGQLEGYMAAVLRQITREGASVDWVEATFSYETSRHRRIGAAVFIRPEVLERSGWPRRPGFPETPEEWEGLGSSFLEAWGRAYGMPAPFYATDDGEGEHTGGLDPLESAEQSMTITPGQKWPRVGIGTGVYAYVA